MLESLRVGLLRFLRVPTHPTLFEGSRDVRFFRASPNYYRYRVALWALAQLGALVGLIFGLLILSRIGREVTNPLALFAFRAGEAFAWGVFVVQLPFSFAIVRMDFELRWYVLSDRSLRIREGILSLREKTMTFANIQQIAIRQNPLQRILGISDVQVRTAGGGNTSEPGNSHVGEAMHEAWFRGVDNAEVIRSAIRERVRVHRDTGLGDPDELPTAPEADTAAVIDAARNLHDEVRALRRVLLAPPLS